MSNADTVKEIYAAFGQGDIETILGHIGASATLEAWDHGHNVADIPYLQPQSGPDGFGAFFGEVATYDIRAFEVLDVIGDGRQIVVEVFIHNVVPSTGKEIQDEELHLWSFDDEGKVARLRHYIDTAKHIEAHTAA